MSATQVPDHVLRKLLDGFVESEAAQIVRDGQAQRGGFVHLGPNIGPVLGWLWREEPDRAFDFLGDLVSAIRTTQNAPDSQLVRMIDLLQGLGLRGPLTDTEYTEMIERAKSELPGRCGVDLHA